MSLLYKVLYAAHANGTHHKLALRSLTLLENAEAERWRRVMLAHAPKLLEGSKAPDKSFKDFQNHVLHPATGHGGKPWGGAPKKAEEWLETAKASMTAGKWSRAAYEFGVLSHYYTDPWMPFHTGSSEEENIVHRAVEWSVNKSFERLWEIAETRMETLARALDKTLPAAGKADWMGRMVSTAAERSSLRYRDLIDHYDFALGSRDPEAGLDDEAEEFIGEILGLAALGLARILDRIAAETEVTPPAVNLTVKTVVAGLDIPMKWVTKKMADAADRKAVEAIYGEFAATGRVVKNLPPEVTSVRQAKAASVEAAKAARAVVEMEEEIETLETRTHIAASDDAGRGGKGAKGAKAAARGGGEVLERAAPVEKAPSIGPKTAKRLQEIGVKTVGDLLDGDPAEIARGLGDRRINAKTIAAWKDQARLLTQVPRLKQAYAVLLVATGYRDVLTIASAAPDSMLRQLAQTAEKPETRRLLRRVETPDLPATARIVENARAALAA